MTDKQKNTIIRLRNDGVTFSKIAKEVNLSINTVKSFYRRSNKDNLTCLYCGKPIVQLKGTRQKKFCSDNCRAKWWTLHGCDEQRNSVYNFTCEYCGKPFRAYGNSHRKYCSHHCYIQSRFGDNCDE